MLHLRTGTTATGRQILAGYTTGIESGTVSVIGLTGGQEISLEPGAKRFLFCLSGAVTLAGRKLAAGGHAWLPEGASALAANGNARLLEVTLPDVAQGSAGLVFGQMDSAAFQAHTSHQAQGQAFTTQRMIDRAMGAGARIFAAAVQPGSGMGLHIHPFDQFYYLVSGNLHYSIGTAENVAGPGDLVIFPAGTAHSNWNAGTEPVIEITINIPEAAQGQANVHHLTITEN